MPATPTNFVYRTEPPAGLRGSLNHSCACLSWLETLQVYSPWANPREELQLRGPVGRRFIGHRLAAEIVPPRKLDRLEPGETEGRCQIILSVPEA